MTTFSYQDLECDLTEEERNTRGRELARQHNALSALETQRSESAAALGVAIKETKSRIETLARAVATGYEVRSVKVEDRKNLDRRSLETIRTDTDEVIASRFLTTEELQQDLFPQVEREVSEDPGPHPGDESIEEKIRALGDDANIVEVHNLNDLVALTTDTNYRVPAAAQAAAEMGGSFEVLDSVVDEEGVVHVTKARLVGVKVMMATTDSPVAPLAFAPLEGLAVVEDVVENLVAVQWGSKTWRVPRAALDHVNEDGGGIQAIDFKENEAGEVVATKVALVPKAPPELDEAAHKLLD